MRLREGLHRLDLPTPLPVGTVNVYLFAEEPVTLIDAGPRSPECLEELERQLQTAGVALADVEQVVLTHGHVDHHGLAETIRRESGAKVLVPDGDRAMVERYTETFASRLARYRAEALRAGAPPATVDLVTEFFEYLLTLGEPTRVESSIREGDRIGAGATILRAVHTPGHSSGSTCYLSDRGELFAGDTLLQDMTPIAAFGGADGESVGLADYIGSLQRVRVLRPRIVYPGHRSLLEDAAAYVRGSVERYEARRKMVLHFLRDGPMTPFELVTRLFGTLPIEEVLLGVTEVLGHLEILEREGIVAVEEKSGVSVVRLK
jgi:glyoxylase-like metal-dependent hydrolase (beta-lactamase superfamily II)